MRKLRVSRYKLRADLGIMEDGRWDKEVRKPRILEEWNKEKSRCGEASSFCCM